MRLHKHFLPSDLKQASKEFWCIKDLLALITKEIERGDLESAKLRSIDLTKSLHELSKLSYKKYRIDNRNVFIQKMQHEGIQVELIRSMVHE